MPPFGYCAEVEKASEGPTPDEGIGPFAMFGVGEASATVMRWVFAGPEKSSK
ncbi:hypothetical protein [Nocardia acidivorans]|uniref:hypothetical protein n=1 Tax=Nocardia acidivorans TaxID=404580 RepID=UPI000AC50CB6|nr:hypothetical protein [Nocardia acidivorans]